MQECPSGKMNKDKFNEIYKMMMASEDKDGKLLDHVFAVFDKNGDGSIDFSEFVLAVGLTNKNDLDSTLELSFAT
jgi:Ca2+-binding EF-hand superfamily protein